MRRYALAGSGPAAWEGLHRLIAADAARLGLRRVGYAPDAGRHAVPGNAGEGLAFGERVIAFLLDGLEAIPSDLLPGQMIHKTAREVAAIRRANVIAGVGLRAFYDALQPGLTEAEVAARVEGAIQARTGRDGVDVARAWAYVQAAANTQVAGGISRSSGYVLAEGDTVLVELGTFADGYWSDLTRSGVVGEPSAAQAALLGAVREAQGAAIAAIRPGVSHEAVDAAARHVLVERGYGDGFTHATGHHVGFRWHDPGPMLAAGSTEPLAAGMVITVEPGTYGPQFNGGARFEDNVLVTEGGAECLSPLALVG